MMSYVGEEKERETATRSINVVRCHCTWRRFVAGVLLFVFCWLYKI